ncbi:MAG TPA: response regulator transcription factor [Microthrixaceae bacterium]|nr:response regulator transcription factor [Microthrixaceae bacterium]
MGARSDPASVLIVEDDRSVAEVVATALRARGHRVEVAVTGDDALATAAASEPDLVLLDLGLPDLDGVEVCVRLRRWFPNPIIVLSADGAEERKVRALDEGADDYVTKPFSMPELLARMRVALRHRELVAAAADPTRLALGDLVVDTGTRVATAAGEQLDLTRIEFDLLVLLGRHPGRVVTQSTILDRAWPEGTSGTTGALRVHVRNLRRKLGEGPDRPTLTTDPGVGYRLEVD